MPKTHYLGETKSGAILARVSTRPDFTHAAASAGHSKGMVLRAGMTTWSTSAAGALRNTGPWGDGKGGIEIVPVRVVTSAEYRAATKGPASDVRAFLGRVGEG